jgi:hypothetical protein
VVLALLATIPGARAQSTGNDLYENAARRRVRQTISSGVSASVTLKACLTRFNCGTFQYLYAHPAERHRRFHGLALPCQHPFSNGFGGINRLLPDAGLPQFPL